MGEYIAYYEYWSQVSRFLHVLFGIAWIGLLYYFNFIGGGYLKQASPEAKKRYASTSSAKCIMVF